MEVHWTKGVDSQGTDLLKSNLSAQPEKSEGVYIIWHGGSDPGIVAVGQGRIREKLQADLKDDRVMAFGNLGLFTAWAPVEINERTGVENFLSKRLMPKVERNIEVAEPISVNLPWRKK